MRQSVTVKVRVYAGHPKRNVYGQVAYAYGVAASWQGAVDPEALCQFNEVVRHLVLVGCSPTLSFLGISAGFHKILALLSALPQGVQFEVRQIITCAGAWHPELFAAAWQAEVARQARRFFQHHVRVPSCTWSGPFQWWWNGGKYGKSSCVCVCLNSTTRARFSSAGSNTRLQAAALVSASVLARTRKPCS